MNNYPIRTPQGTCQEYLPYWIEKAVDEKNGGFYDRIDGEEPVCEFE